MLQGLGWVQGSSNTASIEVLQGSESCGGAASEGPKQDLQSDLT